MSTNLIKITLPKHIVNHNEPNKQNCEMTTEINKNENKRVLPPNSKFKTRLSRDNIENDKNFVNINKNEVLKKINFDKTFQVQAKQSIYTKIPNVRLKESNKKICTKLSLNASKHEIDIKNQTLDSINLEEVNSAKDKKE